ncbi:MAG: hypothetical protein ACP5US_10900 [Candidatus Kryptoniota bacterium]
MYRRIQTSIWNNPKMQELSPEAKLVYMYLYTSDGTSPAGTHKINPKVIDAELGTKDAAFAIAELESKGFLMVLNSAIFIPSFHREQRQSPKFTIAALKFLKTEDDDVKREFVRLYLQEIIIALSTAELRKWEEDYLFEFSSLINSGQKPESISPVQNHFNTPSGSSEINKVEKTCSAPFNNKSNVNELIKGNGKATLSDMLKPPLDRKPVALNKPPSACEIEICTEERIIECEEIKNSIDLYEIETPGNVLFNTVLDTVSNTTDKQIQITDTAAAAAGDFRKSFPHNFGEFSTGFPHSADSLQPKAADLPDFRSESSSKLKSQKPKIFGEGRFSHIDITDLVKKYGEDRVYFFMDYASYVYKNKPIYNHGKLLKKILEESKIYARPYYAKFRKKRLDEKVEVYLTCEKCGHSGYAELNAGRENFRPCSCCQNSATADLRFVDFGRMM